MAKSIFLTIISGVFFIIAATAEAKSEPENTGCIAFRWAPWPGVTKKSAIMVPALVNGKDSMELQLDTGAFRSYINFNTSPNLHTSLAPSTIKSLTVAGVRLDTKNIHLNAPNINDGNTLGIAQLMGTVVVLNLGNQTICIFANKSAPRAVIEKFAWTAGEFRHGHMLTPGWIGKRQVALMLDTGSAYFELYTSKANWQDITSHPSSETTSIVAGNVWGEKVKFHGAHATASLRIGDYGTASPPMTFYREDDPDIFKSGGYYGIVGLSLFSNSTLAFDFSSEIPRLGILKHSPQSD